MLQIKLSRRDQNGEDSAMTHLFAVIIWCDVAGDGDYVTDLELRCIPIGECNGINEWHFQRIAAKFYNDVTMNIHPHKIFVENWQPPEIAASM